MGKSLKLLAMLLLTAMLTIPIYLMISNSFTVNLGFLSTPPSLIPFPLTIEHYVEIVRTPLLSRWILNSILLLIVIPLLGINVSAAAGYVFATTVSKWMNRLFWLLMSPIFVARISVIVAQFVIIGALNLRGLPAVILVPIFWPVGIYLFRNFFASVPLDYLESARIDGAGEWKIFSSIALPMAKPIIGLGVLSLGGVALGDYMWQLLNLTKHTSRTLLVGLSQVALNVTILDNIGFDLAVGTVLFLPAVALFLFAGKYLVKGIAAGGMRG